MIYTPYVRRPSIVNNQGRIQKKGAEEIVARMQSLPPQLKIRVCGDSALQYSWSIGEQKLRLGKTDFF